MSSITFHISQVRTEELLQKFGPILFPDLRKRSKNRLPEQGIIVFAMLEKEVVGSIFGSNYSSNDEFQIITFAVHPQFQNQGIGKQLLAVISEVCKKNKIPKMLIYYRSHWKSTPALGILLAKTGWTEPEENMIIVEGLAKNVLQLFNPTETPYPEKYSTRPWGLMSDADRLSLEKAFLSSNANKDQNPFIQEDTINPTCSLILRYENEIIGWVMSHQISEETNEFTSYFIKEAHRNFRLAHKFMRETIFLQHERTNLPKFIIASQSSNQVMSRFLRRHAEKTDVKLIKTFKSHKYLNF